MFRLLSRLQSVGVSPIRASRGRHVIGTGKEDSKLEHNRLGSAEPGPRLGQRGGQLTPVRGFVFGAYASRVVSKRSIRMMVVSKPGSCVSTRVYGCKRTRCGGEVSSETVPSEGCSDTTIQQPLGVLVDDGWVAATRRVERSCTRVRWTVRFVWRAR